MKSRVNKNIELHQSLSMSLETESQSKDLSHYANRLNEIDDQFRRVEIEGLSSHTPQRARINEPGFSDFHEPQLYDTFENTYLKDFLNEVKEYNVKKGYRTHEDTDAHIVSELTSKPNAVHEDIRSALREMNFESDVQDTNLESTRVYSRDDLNEDLDSVISSLDKTLSMPILEEETLSKDEPQFVTFKEPSESDNESVLEISKDETPDSEIECFDESGESEEIAMGDHEESMTDTQLVIPNYNLDDTFKRSLLEQTQTLQHKIIDQERHLEDMNDVMIRTNRLLHSVISILLLAIFVVIVLVVAQLVP